jgi:thioredoxin reductase (NADPH)
LAKQHFPVVIIGAGPAGLSLASGLKEAHIDFLCLEKEPIAGGQVLKIPSPITNCPFQTYESGHQAKADIHNFVKEAQIDINFGEEALQLEKVDGQFLITTKKGYYTSPNVVVATGASERQLSFNFLERRNHDANDEKENFGSEPEGSNNNKTCRQVFYHSKDLENFLGVQAINSTLAIVGGGDSALLEACNYAHSCRQIYVIHRNMNFKARPDVLKAALETGNILVLAPATITQLLGSPKLKHIKVKLDDLELTLQTDALLAKTGHIPQSALLTQLVTLSSSGHIEVDRYFETSCPGLFAVGDVTAHNFPRIAIAIGQGMQVCQTLIERSFPQALCQLDLARQIEQSLKHFRHHLVGG